MTHLLSVFIQVTLSAAVKEVEDSDDDDDDEHVNECLDLDHFLITDGYFGLPLM
jgi:hypothetical protein